MKKVARRSAAAVILAAVLTIGTRLLCLYVCYGRQVMATYYANGHLSGAVQSIRSTSTTETGFPAYCRGRQEAYSDDRGSI